MAWIGRVSMIFLLGALVALPQDEEPKPQAPPKEQVVECEVVVGKRKQDVYNVPGFKVKESLKLEGKVSADAPLRESLKKAMTYILDQQAEDGSWSVNKNQLRPGAMREVFGFFNTALDSTNKIVMTSLCCLALRANQPLAPARVHDAVQKGFEYVLDRASGHKKARYGVWTWSFSIQFLSQEYRLRKDEGTRARIRQVVSEIVQRLCQNQHKGQLEKPKVEARPPAPKRDEGESRDKKDRQSNGGYFGVVPSDEDDIGKEGALIMSVEPSGPASKGGLKGGDRILQIDDVKCESVNHLYDLVDSLKPGQTVKVQVLRVEGMEEKMKARMSGIERREPRNPFVGKPPEDGGWSYYQTGAVTFGSATAVMALLDAQSVGAEVPKDAIDRGIRFIESQRTLKEETGEEGYTYSQGGNRGPAGDIRGAIGRVCVCELALHKAAGRDLSEVKEAVEIFVKRRGELDRVRGYPGNHFVRSFMNAAYYFLYGHYNSARAAMSLKDEADRRRYGAFIQEALLKIQDEEGTWTDHEAWGRLYGTTMAMMALGELKSLNTGAYARPIPGLEKLGENEY
jgi:hypothetical protein